MRSSSPRIERGKPLLGTIVRIRVTGLPPERAQAAISGAFGVVAEIHRLMSFHEAGSELSRLNTTAWREPVQVSGHTRTVLAKALELARVSNGLFDPTIAPALVAKGLLPRPDLEVSRHCERSEAIQRPPVGALDCFASLAMTASGDRCAANWEDVTLFDKSVAFRCPLWLDLGGIAKGYAVDCAVTYLEAYEPTSLYVEAGGDLRLAGPEPELVRLAAPRSGDAQPVLKIENAALASSGSQPAMDGLLQSPHIDPRTGGFCPTDRFVSVVAPRCIDADALTKIVMAAGADATPILTKYQARAFLLDGTRWSALG